MRATTSSDNLLDTCYYKLKKVRIAPKKINSSNPLLKYNNSNLVPKTLLEKQKLSRKELHEKTGQFEIKR